MPYKKREDLLSSVLTELEVTSLIHMHRGGVSVKHIADHFDIHRNTVRNIVNRAKQSGLYYATDRD